MPDLYALADLGRASVQTLWLPVALWTALALAAEAGLRLGRSRAALGLPVRGAVLAALPLAVAVPAALRALAPAAAEQVAAWTPGVQWLPGVVVGEAPPALVSAGPPALDLALGVAVVLAALLSAVHLARLARSLGALAGARRRLAPAGAIAQAAVDGARERLGVAQPVEAVVAPAGTAPFTVGWRRPVVALPDGLGAAAREVAALHEVAHVRRADFAWHVAQRAVVAAFAAHPLAWALGRGLSLDRERAADALVVDACPGRRRTYADLLFSYASLPAPALALGTAGGSSSLKHRIDAMTSPLSPAQTRRLGRIGRLAGALTLVLSAGLAATAAPSIRSATDPASASDPDVVRAHFTRDGADGARLDLYLADGQTLAHAQALAAEFQADGPGVPVRLRVFYGDRHLERQARMSERGRRLLGAARLLGADWSPDAVPDRIQDLARVLAESAGTAPRDTTDEVFDVAEVQPELIGGLAALQDALVYPPEARADSIEGTVVVQFIVGETGDVQDAVVLRSPDSRLSEAALAAVRQMRFEPGRQRGEPVKVRFAVPVTFRLGGSGRGGDAMQRSGTTITSDGDSPTIRHDVRYSGDLESLLDGETTREFVEALVRSKVASGTEPFRDLTPGSAEIRFRVQDNGRPLIESVTGSSPAMERYGRLKALTTRFRPEAVGREGTMTVTVSQVN